MENPKLQETMDDTHQAPPVDTETNRKSADNQCDVLALDLPLAGDSCPTKDSLCEACQKIDFDALIEACCPGPHPFQRNTLWSLGPLPYRMLEASAKSCRLCRLLVECFKENLDESRCKDGIDPVRISLSIEEVGDCHPCWFIHNRTYHLPYFHIDIRHKNPKADQFPLHRIKFCRRPGLGRPPLGFRVPMPRVPFNTIRSWLNFCQRHHDQKCSEGEKATIQHLRVIDCKSSVRSVVPLPKLDKYMALSYVWGAPQRTVDTPPPLESEGLPSVLPRTIEDAITVTLELDLRYLWVDKYCIPQDDEDEKSRQIQLMDKIYRGAELTIIASAGTDANYGLPGVGSTSRKLSRSIQVGADTLVDMPTSAFSLRLGGATWPRRGWTYQEGILSRRRLVFMENQVYFQCAHMTVWEALDIPLDICHYKAQPGSQLRWPCIYWFHPLFRDSGGIESHISTYFSRELSRPEDTIQAISGIFSHSNNTERPILALSGLPLYVTHPYQPSSSITTLDQLGSPTTALGNAAIAAMIWVFGSSLQIKRREIFPSWTWAGWQQVEEAGFGGYQCPDFTKKIKVPRYATPAMKVALPSEDGLKLMWKGLDELPWEQSRDHLVVQNITLTGWTFRATVSKEGKPEADQFRKNEVNGGLTVVLPNNVITKHWLHCRAPGLVEGNELLALPLCWVFNEMYEEASMPILLLYPTSRKIDSEVVYERVGITACFFLGDNLTALNEEAHPSRLPPWARGKLQEVCIG